MANMMIICSRAHCDLAVTRSDIERISEHLSPDNILHRAPAVNAEEGLLLGYYHGAVLGNVRGTSAYVGNIIGSTDEWHEVDSDIPDGSFALIRSDGDVIELITDMLASRTLWYVKTSDLFVAATSQRAIVCLLASYVPSKASYPWMLANGTMGPGYAWDERIRCMPQDSRLRLDRARWDFQLRTRVTPYQVAERTEDEHREHLRSALQETFDGMSLDPRKWVLPLSGGYDSRAILLMLKDTTGLRCYTIAPGRTDRRGTGYIAKRLAQHLGLPIWFYRRGYLSREPVGVVIERYLQQSEGRVDNIAGYFDGFDLWKDLQERGIFGILRGDEIFGWKPVKDLDDVVRLLELFSFKDYCNFPEPSAFGLTELEWPEDLSPCEGDTPRVWYNKLYQQYRVPYTLAARTDCKSAYVEVGNPLLSRRIVAAARQLPDELHDDKKLFVSIVATMSPDIPFHSSVSEAHDTRFRDLEKAILRNPLNTTAGVTYLRRELDTAFARKVLGDKLVGYVLSSLRVKETPLSRIEQHARHLVRRLFPAELITKAKGNVARAKGRSRTTMDHNKLAFRAYIIVYMNRLLRQDAELLR